MRKRPRQYRFRKAKEDVGGFLSKYRWEPPSAEQINDYITRIVSRWDLTDERGIEDWFRIYTQFECAKKWPQPIEMAPEPPKPVETNNAGNSKIDWSGVDPIGGMRRK
jgi:hypothetical protein